MASSVWRGRRAEAGCRNSVKFTFYVSLFCWQWLPSDSGRINGNPFRGVPPGAVVTCHGGGVRRAGEIAFLFRIVLQVKIMCHLARDPLSCV